MTIEQLQASVARNSSVIASAVLLIRGIAEKIKEAGTPAQREALVNELNANADALAAAVAENTPSEPPA